VKETNKHMSEELREICDEVTPTLQPNTPPAVIEALAIQIQTLRAARRLIDGDGLIVTDGKSNAVAHPALAVERAATTQITDMQRRWGARRRTR